MDTEGPFCLPEELLANYDIMESASKQNPLKVLSTDQERMEYIEKMEKVYKRTTKEHFNYMKSKDYEGNVDEKTWYRIALHLSKEGLLPELGV